MSRDPGSEGFARKSLMDMIKAMQEKHVLQKNQMDGQ